MQKRNLWILAGLAALGLAAWWASTSKSARALATRTENAVTDFLDTLRSLIQQFEGLSLTAYQDEAGKWTIGYGHLIRPGERFVPYGTVSTITQQEADELLQADTAQAQQTVDRHLQVPVTDDQRAALVSFVFNVGAGNFADSTLLAKLNAGDYRGAAAEFAKWNHVTDPETGQLVVSEGLTARRNTESAIFESAIA